jgi:hypothetical protein
MLSHSIDKTQRGDESTVCGRLSDYTSGRGNRTPRNARYRRQTEEEQATAAANEKPFDTQQEYPESLDQLPNNEEDQTTLVDVSYFQSPEGEGSGDTSKQNPEHNLKQREEAPETSQEDDKLNSAQKKEAEVEVINQATT